MLTSSSVPITSGTGAFGHVFVPMTLVKHNTCRLVIYSRDEIKRWGISTQARMEQNRDYIGKVK